MRSSRALVVGVLLLGASLLAPAAPALEGPAFRPVDASAAPTLVGGEPAHYESPGDDGRTRLVAEAVCSQTRLGTIEVTLGWETEAASDAWRVDVSMFGNGFRTGRYLTSDTLPAARGEVDFDQAEPGIYYYWRLLGRGADQWTLRGHGRFEAPICPVDRIEEGS